MSAFNKFKEEVLNSYRKKLNNNELHNKLANPTPANIRDYSLFLIKGELSADDKKTIRDFYASKDDLADLEKAISGIDIDKLKPIKYFINGKTTNPDETIIKLLAVLIDFQPRPFRLDDWSEIEENHKQKIKLFNKIPFGETVQPTHSTELEASNHVHPSATNKSRKKSRFNIPTIIVSGSFALLLGSIGYMNIKEKKECMVWFKDRYISVDCMDNTLRNNQVIPMDKSKLENFRKITRLDTLTLKDVNKIWYSKVNNEVEFFTSSGIHPEHSERGLKLATSYIIQKYAIGDLQEEDQDANNTEMPE